MGDDTGSWSGEQTAATPPSPAATKRFQVPRACKRCRKLRRACSENRPCVRCVDAGVASQCRGSDAFTASAVTWTNSDITQRLLELIPTRVVDYCIGRFFDKLYPTIPVLTLEYVARLRAPIAHVDNEVESACVLVAMCAQIMLQVEDPERVFHQGPAPEKNGVVGRQLLDAALAAHRRLPRSPAVSFEQCLLAFFLYACQATLSHHSQAFLFLREATSLLLLFRSQKPEDVVVSQRLFWVLLISERSHAIRYQRPITLQITADTPAIDSSDPLLTGFWSLAALFRPLNTTFIALLNQEVMAVPPSPEALAYVETAVNSAISPAMALHDTQKANLRVTQLWLRIIIWQLRLHLGFLVEDSAKNSMTFRYPIEVAKDLNLSTRDLSIDCIEIHGVGLTEKLFDVASALVDVLARVPLTASSPQGWAMGTRPEDDLSYLRELIWKLPGGRSVYIDLLEKHIQQTIPSQATPRLEHRSIDT